MYDLTSTTPTSETEYDWLRCSPRGKEEGKTQSERSTGQLQATKVETTFLLWNISWVTTEPRRYQQTLRLKPGDRSASIWKPRSSQCRTPSQNWNPNTTQMGPHCHKICGGLSLESIEGFVQNIPNKFWQHTQALFSSPWRTIYLNGFTAMLFVHWNYKYIAQHWVCFMQTSILVLIRFLEYLGCVLLHMVLRHLDMLAVATQDIPGYHGM